MVLATPSPGAPCLLDPGRVTAGPTRTLAYGAWGYWCSLVSPPLIQPRLQSGVVNAGSEYLGMMRSSIPKKRWLQESSPHQTLESTGDLGGDSSVVFEQRHVSPERGSFADFGHA